MAPPAIAVTDQMKARLSLFWETTQPLRRVVEELPDLSDGVRFHLRPSIPRKLIARGADPFEVLSSSTSAELEVVFPNLPEALFERLALRFRPFYANDEQVNLLSILKLLAQHNVHLREWRQKRKRSWESAVFWGAMGMPNRDPPVDAEDVIRTGLYSRYFHLNVECREQALAYERSLGEGMFRIALVSSVWQRSLIVVMVAKELEGELVNHGIVDAQTVDAARAVVVEPDTISLNLSGGPGSIQFRPLE